MTIPLRIRRERAKGWRMPPNTLYVGRPTMWQNRWKIGTPSNTLGRNVQTVEEAVQLYIQLAWPDAHHRNWIRENLRGFNLMCWCKLCEAHAQGKPFNVDCAACAPCHADWLGAIANS